MAPKQARKGKKVQKSPWQQHGGALFDSMSKAALERLKAKLGLNTELNYADANGTTTATSTLASRITMPTIPQGVGVGSRVGASLRIAKLQLRIHVAPAATMSADTSVRFLLVRNRDAGNAQVSNILQTTTLFSSPLNSELEALNIDVLDDWIAQCGTVTSGTGNIDIVRTYTRDDWHVNYDVTDTSGAVANIIGGAMSLYWYVDQVNTLAPVFTSTMRYWYVDN